MAEMDGLSDAIDRRWRAMVLLAYGAAFASASLRGCADGTSICCTAGWTP